MRAEINSKRRKISYITISNKEKKIATLNYRIEVLEKQIDKINQELKECDVNIEIESRSPGFEERGTGVHQMEQAVQKEK